LFLLSVEGDIGKVQKRKNKKGSIEIKISLQPLQKGLPGKPSHNNLQKAKELAVT
jgi:hypothetical protein